MGRIRGRGLSGVEVFGLGDEVLWMRWFFARLARKGGGACRARLLVLGR